jgi:CheY-like chemotaxis protein
LIVRCLKDHRLANEVHHAADGEAALDYLFRRGAYSHQARSPRPHLGLLDHRLPKIDGLEVLRQIKASEELRQIPVAVLTTSDAENDVTGAYRNFVNSYLVKPLDPDQFRQLINDLGHYWMGWNRRPCCRQGH